MATTRAHQARARTQRRGPATDAARRQRARARIHHRRWLGWAVAGTVALAAIVGVALGGRTPPTTATGPAPSFRLASTDGAEVSLADYRGRNVLLYFNEGVGCDACFFQTGKLEADQTFKGLDVTLLPIVMNAAAQVETELRRFGLQTPYLVDPDGSVSRAYDVLGTGHHANLPGHSFILVGPDGRMRWRGDYPGMWIEPAELASTVRAELAPEVSTTTERR